MPQIGFANQTDRAFISIRFLFIRHAGDMTIKKAHVIIIRAIGRCGGKIRKKNNIIPRLCDSAKELSIERINSTDTLGRKLYYSTASDIHSV